MRILKPKKVTYVSIGEKNEKERKTSTLRELSN